MFVFQSSSVVTCSRPCEFFFLLTSKNCWVIFGLHSYGRAWRKQTSEHVASVKSKKIIMMLTMSLCSRFWLPHSVDCVLSAVPNGEIYIKSPSHNLKSSQNVKEEIDSTVIPLRRLLEGMTANTGPLVWDLPRMNTTKRLKWQSAELLGLAHCLCEFDLFYLGVSSDAHPDDPGVTDNKSTRWQTVLSD